MKRWKTGLGGILIGLVLAAGQATAADQAWKFDLAKELVGISGVNSISEQVTQNLIVEMSRSLQQSNPQLPDDAGEIVQAAVEEAAEARAAELNDQIARLYTTSFTLEELQALLAWYESGVGKKALQVMPIIAQQSIELGKQWRGLVGQAAAEEAVKRLEAKGYEVK